MFPKKFFLFFDIIYRHGEPDYTYGDTRGFIGHGHDLAPLKQDKIKKEQLQTRVMSAINKYKNEYDTVIVVAHKIAFQSICDCGDMKPAEIFETTF